VDLHDGKISVYSAGEGKGEIISHCITLQRIGAIRSYLSVFSYLFFRLFFHS
jgi:hypothetical protein